MWQGLVIPVDGDIREVGWRTLADLFTPMGVDGVDWITLKPHETQLIVGEWSLHDGSALNPRGTALMRVLGYRGESRGPLAVIGCTVVGSQADVPDAVRKLVGQLTELVAT